MSIVKIKRYDKWRVLLTEVLPYETPMIFSNNGFYVISQTKLSVKYFEQRIKTAIPDMNQKAKEIFYNFLFHIT
ncbi:MAG: hypothetical protein IPO94_02810 [Saprospiraceae bacterium]|nr:hypothetical protein [Saprospiraceae bacterium]